MPSWSTRPADPSTGSCRAQRPLRSEPRSRPSRSPSPARRPASRTSSAGSSLGTSTHEPSTRDRRFADPGWTTTRFLRRAVQTYLAAGESLQRLVDDAELGRRDELRMRFLADNLYDAAAPSNLPWLNPAALKAVVDTGGANLVRGAAATSSATWRSRRASPAWSTKDAFEVGENLAVTPGAVVLRTRCSS